MIITEKQTEDSTQSRQHCSDENSLRSLEQHYAFIHRHIGIDDASMQEILSFLGVKSLEELLQKAVPQDILQDDSGELSALSEQATLAYLFKLLKKNLPHRSFIGMGYYGTELPSVILRNVLENPGWYTAYTPYQAEVAQGRMEMLLNFQQLTLDLTGMEIASASLLDEATAAAEAMMMARRITKKHKTNIFYVDQSCHPQTIDVIKTRAEYMDIEVVTGPADQVSQYDIFGVLFAYPGTFGDIHDYKNLISTLHQKKIIVAMVADMMSLVMLESPGHLGADIALGSSQRFGVPMGFGGPHAAFFATKNEYSRSMPGRIIGLSIDSRGRPAYRMALQTREQHIRRDKATSNICTSQVLLANIAACYAIWHGPQGLQKIARRIHRLTNIFAAGLAQYSIQPVNSSWFDTLTF
ncbi:MAG: glycine dehydrogenase, partial [Endozoicomonadaceae bacterium]|nr:glycine dehydrogenase [Endozoicomonadaceae bacterium]